MGIVAFCSKKEQACPAMNNLNPGKRIKEQRWFISNLCLVLNESDKLRQNK
jgi:hypothetical protein